MQHIAKNKRCMLQDLVKEYYKKLTQGYSMDRKRKYQAKWDEDNRQYKLSKDAKYRKENKKSKAAYDAKRYQDSKDSIAKKYQERKKEKENCENRHISVPFFQF